MTKRWDQSSTTNYLIGVRSRGLRAVATDDSTDTVSLPWDFGGRGGTLAVRGERGEDSRFVPPAQSLSLTFQGFARSARPRGAVPAGLRGDVYAKFSSNRAIGNMAGVNGRGTDFQQSPY